MSVPGWSAPAAGLSWAGVGDGLAAARPAGEPPGGPAWREEEVFFSSFLVTILQLGYGRDPGLDAVRFKAAVLTPHLKKKKKSEFPTCTPLCMNLLFSFWSEAIVAVKRREGKRKLSRGNASRHLEPAVMLGRAG